MTTHSILRRRFALAALGLLLPGCGPTIKGAWEASGHLGVADPFALEVSFQTDNLGTAFYSAALDAEHQVPVCETTLRENRVRFVIDTGGKTTCATLNKPLAFSGVIGEDVIVGEIQDAAGAKVGIWRAFRKPKK